MDIFTDDWKPLSEAAKILGVSPEEIESLISGISVCASSRSPSLRLVNLQEIEKFLKETTRISESLFSADNKNDNVMIPGKKAAKIMLISLDLLSGLCEDKRLPAERKGRGWLINEKVLKDFMIANPDLVASLRAKSPAVPPRRLNPGEGSPGGNPGADPPPSGGDSPPDDEDKKNPPEDAGSDEKQKGSSPVPAPPPPDPKGSDDGKYLEEIEIVQRKHNGRLFCRIDDVASALVTRDEGRVKRWIKDGKVTAVEAKEGAKITWYIYPESLQTFMKENGKKVKFVEPEQRKPH